MGDDVQELPAYLVEPTPVQPAQVALPESPQTAPQAGTAEQLLQTF
jgi:hypothetical protein